MARGRKPKIVEKIADVVDKVIHPHPETATQAEAEEMVKSGEAEIPAESIVSEKPRSQYREHMSGWESKKEKAAAKSRSSDQDLDYASHPKFHKFKGKAKGAE